jgi:hypothetical protein
VRAGGGLRCLPERPAPVGGSFLPEIIDPLSGRICPRGRRASWF